MLRALRNLVERARSGIAVALSDGQGIYLVALVCLGVAALFLHRALTPEWNYRDALKRLVVSQQEPYRGETHPVLASGLLYRAEKWDACEDEELLATTDAVAAAFRLKLPESDGAASPLDPLQPCTDAGACPPKTAGLGPSWSDGGVGTSILMVPSTVATALSRREHTLQVLDASRELESLDATLGRDGDRVIDSRFPSGSTVRSMYFIDLVGDIRYLPREEWPSSALPAHRGFAGGSYVYNSLAGDRGECERPRGSVAVTETRPYLDLAGGGVVRTLCYPVARNAVAGTLCFDVAPSDDVVRSMLSGAADLFDLHLVRFQAGRFEACPSRDLPCEPELARLDERELERLEAEWVRDLSNVGSAGASAVDLLEHDNYFATVVGTGADYQDIVFGRLGHSPGRDLVASALMLLFILAACGLVVVGWRRKSRRLDVTLIRGLQVGVVEVNDKDRIVGANDRAEEIFGIHLPTFDEPKADMQVWFRNQIEQDIVLLDDAGRLPPGQVRFTPYSALDDDRASGHSSSYYAFTTNLQQWIRVSGSTIVKPKRERHTFGMLDTYVDERHLRRLETARTERIRDQERIR